MDQIRSPASHAPHHTHSDVRSTRRLQYTSDRIPKSPIACDHQPIARIASFQSISTHPMNRSNMHTLQRKTPPPNPPILKAVDPTPRSTSARSSLIILDHPWSSSIIPDHPRSSSIILDHRRRQHRSYIVVASLLPKCTTQPTNSGQFWCNTLFSLRYVQRISHPSSQPYHVPPPPCLPIVARRQLLQSLLSLCGQPSILAILSLNYWPIDCLV